MLRIVFIASALLLSANVAAVPIASEHFHDFVASGLAPGGGDGRLDSNRWAITGLSDGNSAFGETRLSGDFARGVAAAPVRTGGLYAFTLPDRAVGLGVQSTGSDFTPGSMIWRVENASENTWRDLHINVDFWYRNDGDRASELRLDTSTSGDRWTTHDAATRFTPQHADTGLWQVHRISEALPMLSVAPLSALLLRFTFSDASATGTRDELALASLRLSAGGGPSQTLPLAAPASVLIVLPLLLTLAAWCAMTRTPAVREPAIK